MSTRLRFAYYDEMMILPKDIVCFDFDFMDFNGLGHDILKIRVEKEDGSYVVMPPVPILPGQIGYLMVMLNGRLHQRVFKGKDCQWDHRSNQCAWSHLEDNLLYFDPAITGEVCRCIRDCFCINSFYGPRF